MNSGKSVTDKKNPKRLALNLLSTPSKCNNHTIFLQHQTNSVYYQQGPACILPNLYLGAHYNACNTAQLAHHQINCIVNVASEIILKPKDVEYHHLPWKHSQHDLAQCEFGRAINLIETAHCQNQIVLVHCQQGIERSTALVVAFLMRSSHRIKKITATASNTDNLAGQNWSLDQALTFVQKKAPGIRPNMELIYQLREYEKQLLLACPQQLQKDIQTRARRSGSVGCSKPIITTPPSSLRSTLLGHQQRPRSASLRESSSSASAIAVGIKSKEPPVAKLRMQVAPVQQEKKNKSILALASILVLLAVAIHQQKFKMYHYSSRNNSNSDRLLTFTYDMNDDNLTKNSNSRSGNNSLNHTISFFFKSVYPIF